MTECRKLLVTLLVLLMSACSHVSEVDNWPQGLPAQENFISEYQSDEVNQALQSEEEYLLWVERFYQGANLVPGWLGMTDQVLSELTEPQRSEVSARLYLLGSEIAQQWAKDNKVRLVDTRSVSAWRDALLEALNQHDMEQYLNRLDLDVAALLAGELSKDEVYFGRYYYDEFDDS